MHDCHEVEERYVLGYVSGGLLGGLCMSATRVMYILHTHNVVGHAGVATLASPQRRTPTTSLYPLHVYTLACALWVETKRAPRAAWARGVINTLKNEHLYALLRDG